MGLGALGVFLIVLGFRVHRELLGFILGCIFLILGLGTLALFVGFFAAIDRILDRASPAEQSVLAHSMRAADPTLVPPSPIAVPLPYVLGQSVANGDRVRLGALVIMGCALVLRLTWRSAPVLAGMIGAAIGVGILLALSIRRASQLVVDVDGTVRASGLFKQSVAIPVSQVSQVALRRIILFSRWRDDIPRLLLIDRAGRCLLWMNAVGITYEDASQLAAALRVPIDPNWKESRTSGWLAREFPGSTSRIEAHPFLVGALVIAAIVAILIGIAWPQAG